MKIDEIIVKDRIRKDAGGMMELINDIKANGLINPVTVNTDHVLLAGYRRLSACKALGWTDIPAHMVSTENEEQELRVEISENEVRKEFTMTERLDYARRLQRIESIKADQRQKDGKDLSQNSDKGRTDEIVSKQTGIGSRDTLRKAQVIAENKDKFDPEEFKDWDDGKLSTNKLYTQLKQQKSALAEENKRLKDEVDAEKHKSPIIKTVEKLVTPDDYEDLKKANVRLYNENKKHIEEAQEWERKFRGSGKIEPTLDQKASKDIDWLTMGIMEFLRTYGGKAWGVDRRASIEKYRTDELKAQARNLLAFAQNLYTIASEDNSQKEAEQGVKNDNQE